MILISITSILTGEYHS